MALEGFPDPMFCGTDLFTVRWGNTFFCLFAHLKNDLDFLETDINKYKNLSAKYIT